MWWCPSSHLETFEDVKVGEFWMQFSNVSKGRRFLEVTHEIFHQSEVSNHSFSEAGGFFWSSFQEVFLDPERSLKLKPNGLSKIRITTAFCSCCRISGGRSLRLKPLNGDNQMWITDYICLDDTAFEWPCYVETAGNSFVACPVALDVQTAQQKTWCWVQSKSLPQCEALTTMRSAKLLGPAYAPLVEQATAFTELRMDVWENISQTWTSHSWGCEA